MTLKSSIVIGFIACGFLETLSGSEVNVSAMEQTTGSKEELFQRKKEMVKDLINSRLANNICWDIEAECSLIKNILLEVGATNVKLNEVTDGVLPNLPEGIDRYLKLLKCKLGEERVYVLVYPRVLEGMIAEGDTAIEEMSQLEVAVGNCGVACYRLGERKGESIKMPLNFYGRYGNELGLIRGIGSDLTWREDAVRTLFVEENEKKIMDIIEKNDDNIAALLEILKIENEQTIAKSMITKLSNSNTRNTNKTMMGRPVRKKI